MSRWDNTQLLNVQGRLVLQIYWTPFVVTHRTCPHDILCPQQTLARARGLTVQPGPCADCDLSIGDFYHPSPGFDHSGIGIISPPFIVQFLDNSVDLRLKNFKPPVRCFALMFVAFREDDVGATLPLENAAVNSQIARGRGPPCRVV